MIIAVYSNISYLLEKQARSQAGGHLYQTNHNDKIFNNGSVLTISSIIKHIMASTSEAELAAVFYNYHEAIPLRIILEEMGHLEPPLTSLLIIQQRTDSPMEQWLRRLKSN